MGRLIDADELINSLGVSDRDIYCKEVIEDAPTADTTIKGKWNKMGGYSQIYSYRCSNCGTYHRGRTNYCPSCGADMGER